MVCFDLSEADGNSLRFANFSLSMYNLHFTSFDSIGNCASFLLDPSKHLAECITLLQNELGFIKIKFG